MSRSARLLWVIVATVLLVADVVLTVSVRGATSTAVGVVEILWALALQALLVMLSWIWSRYRPRSEANLREPGSYRALLPITPIGIMLLGAALSLSLLYVGLVCPGEGLPTVRGRGFCS